MPKDSTRNTLARQWELLQLLPRRGLGLFAQQLADALAHKGFAVSLRSVQRDLRELELSFDLLCDREHKPALWRWADGAATDLHALSSEEATSLAMIEQAALAQLPQAVLQTLEPRFELARAKLQALSEHRASALAANYRFVSNGWPLQAPVVDTPILQTVQKALAAQEQVLVHYQNAPQLQAAVFQEQAMPAGPQTLHPLGLINRGPVTYLLATSGHYSDPRLYALHRMQDAQLTYQTARRPQGFELDHWIAQHMQFGSGQSVHLRAHVSTALAGMLRETPLAPDQQLHRQPDSDFPFTLQATVQDSMQLQWWILSQSADLEILQPAALRQRIAERLAHSHALYANTAT